LQYEAKLPLLSTVDGKTPQIVNCQKHHACENGQKGDQQAGVEQQVGK